MEKERKKRKRKKKFIHFLFGRVCLSFSFFFFSFERERESVVGFVRFRSLRTTSLVRSVFLESLSTSTTADQSHLGTAKVFSKTPKKDSAFDSSAIKKTKQKNKTMNSPLLFAPVSASDDIAALYEAQATMPRATIVSNDAARAKLVQWMFAVRAVFLSFANLFFPASKSLDRRADSMPCRR